MFAKRKKTDGLGNLINYSYLCERYISSCYELHQKLDYARSFEVLGTGKKNLSDS